MTKTATTVAKTTTGHPPLDYSPPPIHLHPYQIGSREGKQLKGGEGNNRDVKRAYAKMSTKEKETLNQRMAEIDKAAVSDKENTPPSLTPI
jgi:hypothetical protein